MFRSDLLRSKSSGRAALEHLLDSATFPGSFVWDLYFGPDVKTYMLNFIYVESAGPAVKSLRRPIPTVSRRKVGRTGVHFAPAFVRRKAIQLAGTL
jgi:hypothetical protein